MLAATILLLYINFPCYIYYLQKKKKNELNSRKKSFQSKVILKTRIIITKIFSLVFIFEKLLTITNHILL